MLVTPPRQRSKVLRRTLAPLGVVFVVGALLAVVAPGASAQIADLDPDLCATTYKPTANAGPKTEADCRTIVAWRNTVVSHPDSVIGADHPMALWGTGAQTKFNTWAGLKVEIVNGERVLTTIDMSRRSLGGPLPGSLPYVTEIYLWTNFLSGELPAWIYSSSTLQILSLGDNRLSGEVSAFTAPNLGILNLYTNRFSGSLPAFDLPNMPTLRVVSFDHNFFSGVIPPSWSGFADGRGVQRIDFTSNNISGNVPGWVSNLRFANTPTPPWTKAERYYEYTLNWRSNKLCIPSNFVIPTYLKLDGSNARVAMYWQPQRCPTSNHQFLSQSQSVRNLNYEVVDVQVDAEGRQASHEDATEMVATVKGLRVTFDKPNGLPAVRVVYDVWSYLNVPTHENAIPQPDGTTFYRYCPQDELTATTGTVDPTETTFEVIITRNNCGITDTNTLYDPTKYNIAVAVRFRTGRTAFLGTAGPRNTWGIYMADDPQKTYRDVVNVLGLGYARDIWVWDAANQVWITRRQSDIDFSSHNLEPGTALAFQIRVPLAWLDRAGLSTADEDTPVQLQNGWNIISAGGAATRPDDNNGAFFIDGSLIDCNSNQGAIAIIRYDTYTESFDAELPCHSQAEASMTRSESVGTIDNLEEGDILFINFRTILPVTIQWDPDDNRYEPLTP